VKLGKHPFTVVGVARLRGFPRSGAVLVLAGLLDTDDERGRRLEARITCVAGHSEAVTVIGRLKPGRGHTANRRTDNLNAICG